MTLLSIWLIAAGPLWAVVGGTLMPRRYRKLGLDPRLTGMAATLWGAAMGPLVLIYLYLRTPDLRHKPFLWTWLPALFLAYELVSFYSLAYPTSPLVTNPLYLLNQVQNGLAMGFVYAIMAVGLTLIFSVQGIINFAHGQLFMFGGVIGYLLLTQVLEVNAFFAIPVVGVLALVVGLFIEKALLAPLHKGDIERPEEYAILITFGVGLFLQYALVGMLGSPTGIRAPRYTDRPPLESIPSTLRFGDFWIRTDILIAGLIGLILFLALILFLQRTWTGKTLRAVAMNQQAATVTGIDSGRAFNLAFGIGIMLTGMAGATLVAVMNFPVPELATRAAIRAYVIIVLGGLGSLPGTLLGGLFLGVAESLVAAGFPDPSRSATYQTAAGLFLFAIILLIRPQGLMGRKK